MTVRMLGLLDRRFMWRFQQRQSCEFLDFLQINLRNFLVFDLLNKPSYEKFIHLTLSHIFFQNAKVVSVQFQFRIAMQCYKGNAEGITIVQYVLISFLYWLGIIVCIIKQLWTSSSWRLIYRLNSDSSPNLKTVNIFLGFYSHHFLFSINFQSQWCKATRI